MIVLVILGFSEWIGHQMTSHFLSEHEMHMESEMNHGAVLGGLRQGRQALLVNLTTLHVLHGVFTVLALIIALNALWSRTVLRPLNDLLRHINYMSRGNWATSVPVRSNDEIGELTEAFNKLGGQLTLTVQQYGATSKLSAMALLGQSMVKKARSAAELLRASADQFEEGQGHDHSSTDPDQARLRLALQIIEEVPALFDAEFQHQLSLHSAPNAPAEQMSSPVADGGTDGCPA